MKQYGIDAVPFKHEMMDEWRENFKGVRFLHEPTNLLITGAVDDIWQNPTGELIVVDYKATAKTVRSTWMLSGRWDTNARWKYTSGLSPAWLQGFRYRLFRVLQRKIGFGRV